MDSILSQICQVNDIKVKTYKNSSKLLKTLNLEEFTKQYKSFSFETPCKNSRAVVLLDDNLKESAKNAVLSHELGHILLGHVSDDLNVQRGNVGDCKYEELLADIFGAVLTAFNVFWKLKQKEEGEMYV